MSVQWRRRALLDLQRIVAHIADENPVAARRVSRELLLAADSLSVFPRRGRLGLLPGTREMVALSPYILVYRVAETEVTILRVWHGAQDR